MERTNHEDFRTQPVRVGFYDMEETIGKGNFAVVKLARHKITKSRVSIIIMKIFLYLIVLLCRFVYAYLHSQEKSYL